MQMMEYRCQQTKPDGRRCNAKLFEASFEGELDIKCYRCNQHNVIDTRKQFSAAEAVTVDLTERVTIEA